MRLVVACMACGLGIGGATLASGASSASEPVPALNALIWVIADAPADAELLAARRGALEAQIERAATTLDRVGAQLTLANWLLAIPSAGPATRILVGMPTEDDVSKLAELGRTAGQLIERARQEVSTYAQGAASAPASTTPSAIRGTERVRELQATADNLNSFAAVFACFGALGRGEEMEANWSRAARGLAGTREAPDAKLAAAALLWQAFAWHKAGRTDRALGLLPKTLLPTTEPDYDFLARLLRCRILIEQQQGVAVLVLLTRLRSVCIPAWFDAESDDLRTARQRLVGLLELRASAAWQAQLSKAGSVSTARQHAEDMADLASQLGKLNPADAASRAYLFKEAIPILIELNEKSMSDAASEQSQTGALTATSATLITASQPASASASAPSP